MFDVVVVGAGVFGAWTAYELQRAHLRVGLIDQYGPANSRSSSGGETRIVRMGYGPDAIYTRYAVRSLDKWQGLCSSRGLRLFHETGVLWMGRSGDPRLEATGRTLRAAGVAHENLDAPELGRRYPQIALSDIDRAIFEPKSGALMARRSVAAVTEALVEAGGTLLQEGVARPRERERLDAIESISGRRIPAGTFVFACGCWLPRLFPAILGNRIFPTRQEVFFLGAAPGDPRFAAPAMPAWLDQGALYYGVPDIESRGFKIASDQHGPPVDPDTQMRVVSLGGIEAMRGFVAQRFPGLRDAPIVETRVCQYENTWNGDFVIDRHPGIDNVFVVGGGSGHGFKHGPAVGEYAARLVLGTLDDPEPRFNLDSKKTVPARAVY